MILIQDKLKMSDNTTIFIIFLIMLSLTLILIYPNFINLPDSFAQTTTIGTNDTTSLSSSTARPPSSLFLPRPASPELSAAQKKCINKQNMHTGVFIINKGQWYTTTDRRPVF